VAAPRVRKHIVVPSKPTAEAYKPHPRKIDVAKPPAPPSRATHGRALKRALDAAVTEAHQRRADAGIQVHGAVPGLYVQFESQPGVPLKLSTLEDARQGIELVAVNYTRPVASGSAPGRPGQKPGSENAAPRLVERATVFVPEGKVKHFVDRFAAYSKTTPKKKRERRHEDMLDPVASLRLATLRALWTDSTEVYPADDETIWWEVWLRRQDGSELGRLMEFAELKRLDVAARRLQFDDRIVTLVRATSEQLSASIDVLNDLAEVRRAKETAMVFVDMSPEEQGEWAGLGPTGVGFASLRCPVIVRISDCPAGIRPRHLVSHEHDTVECWQASCCVVGRCCPGKCYPDSSTWSRAAAPSDSSCCGRTLRPTTRSRMR
jgi:hypothetical protein